MTPFKGESYDFWKMVKVNKIKTDLKQTKFRKLNIHDGLCKKSLILVK